MKNYIKHDEWNIIEEGFNPALNKVSESIFSIGNGRMGQRANFEERYGGESLQGSYVAGVYYPDKTRVGWWKNGYPEYFAKVLNAPSWIGIDVFVDGEPLDLHRLEILRFRRQLCMKDGYLSRSFTARFEDGREVAVEATRFCSLVDDECGALSYRISARNFDGRFVVIPYLDGGVRNMDSNYDETFWEYVAASTAPNRSVLTMRTKKTDFWVTTGMHYELLADEGRIQCSEQDVRRDDYIGKSVTFDLAAGQSIAVRKYAVVLSSENHPKADMEARASAMLDRVVAKGFDRMMAEQSEAWGQKWEESDIRIGGDIAAQQAIRFNIFQLHQTYSGEDERLNIGPKGFTGEKYGGATYWDTEAYCLPFYLATAPPAVAKNLLLYRYRHLPKAIENARKLGFDGGAALFPMVTMNGEECHNEWEITFEEIHRNGAIAFAIYNYVRYTGDDEYLADYGLEVLIGIARFWAQRVNWSEYRQRYVILGVTGPNEYENNVNNNWYTNTMAVWCLTYALEALPAVRHAWPAKYEAVITRTAFDERHETGTWETIVEKMYYPVDGERGIFLQQDGFLDKELVPAESLPAEQRPLNQHWSWDRILRSCYIKQADVLQGIYLLEDRFDLETIRRNVDFYEPLTVHESSLSPCVHAILAAKLGDEERAYQFYLRTARLDLDDYNNDTEDGLHITSMAGTWMSIVEGFAGMRVRDGRLHFSPMLPVKWQSYEFSIRFRGTVLTVKVSRSGVLLAHSGSDPLTVFVFGHPYRVPREASVELAGGHRI
ncbi:glycoside hydrolase family 65 protein [Parapedobacter sp. ISTM3]|uniref:glycoside hydrolase family 65 protein n=1 Tax=Parapedobacter sp. ISTM3 TaxID=2800130 RepID=UPI00190381DB|nr:glycoside hydrolase family 65 protein [Parapedobacter sp. ISTM3]MBK1438673.1 glycoside hydrolase family 65 protein [Parapedobacter sp. ISTM3]